MLLLFFCYCYLLLFLLLLQIFLEEIRSRKLILEEGKEQNKFDCLFLTTLILEKVLRRFSKKKLAQLISKKTVNAFLVQFWMKLRPFSWEFLHLSQLIHLSAPTRPSPTLRGAYTLTSNKEQNWFCSFILFIYDGNFHSCIHD